MFFFMIIFLVLLIIFLIFCFPVIDDDLLFMGSQVDRLPVNESRIEFFDIVTSDILFSMSRQVSLHDIGKCIHENIERFTVFISIVMSMFSLPYFLKVFDYGSGISRTKKSKFFPTW